VGFSFYFKLLNYKNMLLELSVSHYNPPIGKEPSLNSWDELVETLDIESSKPVEFSKPVESSKPVEFSKPVEPTKASRKTTTPLKPSEASKE
jgi:hypothetical protein